MLLYQILFLLLSSVKCHISNNKFYNISMGIINAQTVISCGFSINIYSSFNLTEIRNCPQVSIQEKTIQLFEMNICKLSNLRRKKRHSKK